MKNRNILYEVSHILEHISKALLVERSSLFLLNSELNTLESIVAQGVENVIFSLPISQGIAGACFRAKRSILENDVQNNKDFDPQYDKLLHFSTQSTLCIPIFNEAGEAIGVIQCVNKQQGMFKEQDISILMGFGHTMALLVKNVQLYQLSDQLKDNFSQLLDVFAMVSSELNLDNLIQLIMVKAAELTQADRSSLFFMDHERKELWTKYAKGMEEEIVRTKKGIVAWVAENRIPCLVNDPYNFEHFDASIDRKTGYTTKSILSVPIFHKNREVLGVIQLINKNNGSFTKEDLSIIEGFASQIRIALDNAQLFEQISGMKNYLNILIQNLDNGIVTVDKSLRIQTANNTFYRMFDLPGDQDLSHCKLNTLEDELYHVLQYSLKTIATGKRHYEYGLEYLTEKNKKVVANLSILPMEDTNGAIIGAVNVFQDITKEKRIRSNLSRYIPQHLVNEVINKEDLSILQSKNRICSILFSDIRNFTKLTEELGANQIVSLLNTYFDAMVGIIHDLNGVLDKFVGDAAMAVFGVPYTNNSDAVNAVKCALHMFRKLDEINKNSETQLNIGIGISTGNVVSGNIGSEKRFEYTVIGDPVNVAARLESETKKYGLKVLICENTYQKISPYFRCREIDAVILKGRQKPVRVYTVLGEISIPISEREQIFLNYFSDGLQLYRKGKFERAKSLFKQANKINKEDKPTRLFLEKCYKISRASIVEK